MKRTMTSGILLVATLVAVGVTAPDAIPSGAAHCQVDYQRADNMWAAEGRPDGNLGVETVLLDRDGPGRARVFNTDWRYEKRRNDGVNYYGSHLRIAENKSAKSSVTLRIRSGGGALSEFAVVLRPGERKTYRHDLMSVTCG